jgi:hypothetical protein
MRIAGAAHGGRCYREALLALLVAGAFFSTAHEANAKFRARHHTQIPYSHHISVVRPGPVQRLENQRPGDIYESLSGGRQLYANPDRDFFGPNAGGKIY